MEAEAAATARAPAARVERAARLEKALDVPIFVAALLVIPVIVIEQAHVGNGWKTFGSVLNWTIWGAFSLEAVAMLAVSRDRIGWIRRHPVSVAIVILTPPFLPGSLSALRLFRLLRVLRIAVVVREYRRLFTFDGVRGAAVVAVVAALGGGAIFSNVENGHSMWDGVWWAASTMTTVGYGDISPRTTAGRVLGITLMLIGIGFVALLTGAVAQRFLSPEIERDVAEVEVQLAGDTEEARDAILRELRQINARLHELQGVIERTS